MSKEHHWWPVGLQKYWEDKNGDVSWIKPDGEIVSKRRKNRNIGKTRFGHTMLRGTAWERNFEPFFDQEDNEIHQTIETLQTLKGGGRTIREFAGIVIDIIRRDLGYSRLVKVHEFDDDAHRRLVRLVYSLLIRSPAARRQRENYVKLARPDAEPHPESGKANMSQDYSVARRLWERSSISRQTFVLLHSPIKRFITGDGYYDALTSSLVAGRIDGKALVPLTPNLCVYFCTPSPKKGSDNLISLTTPPRMVDMINDRTQVYSKEHLFFLGKPPELNEGYAQNEFLRYAEERDEVIDTLDEIAGWDRRSFDQIGRVLGHRDR